MTNLQTLSGRGIIPPPDRDLWPAGSFPGEPQFGDHVVQG